MGEHLNHSLTVDTNHRCRSFTVTQGISSLPPELLSHIFVPITR